MKRHPNQRAERPKAKRGRTPMDEALKYLAARARTVREVERHLDECQFGEFEVQQVVDRLLELNYLNDAAYAEEFVRTRLATKPVSRRKLREQLAGHELPEHIIEAALADVPEEVERENAASVARKFARQFARRGLSPEEAREQLMRRLAARGYSYEDARRAVAALEEGQEEA